MPVFSLHIFYLAFFGSKLIKPAHYLSPAGKGRMGKFGQVYLNKHHSLKTYIPIKINKCKKESPSIL